MRLEKAVVREAGSRLLVMRFVGIEEGLCCGLKCDNLFVRRHVLCCHGPVLRSVVDSEILAFRRQFKVREEQLDMRAAAFLHFRRMFFIIHNKRRVPISSSRIRRKMGKKDNALELYFEDNERYADLINGYVFNGEQIVRGQDISEKDGRASGVAGRIRKRLEVQKYRDAMRRVALGTEFVLIGLEHQDEIHYAMPVRVMLQDAAGYDEQLRSVRRLNRRRRGLNGGEFLGGFTREDRMKPVLTLVLYYGTEAWDGARDLYGLMDRNKYPEQIMDMVNNYRIHVLEVRRFREIGCFRTDLYEVFGFIQKAGDKEAERLFTEENRIRFEAMDEEAFDVITALTGSGELEAEKERCRDEGGKINMCEAIRGMIEDGRIEGRAEGRAEGEFKKTERVARNMYSRGMSAEDTAAICEVELSQVKEWFERWRPER